MVTQTTYSDDNDFETQEDIVDQHDPNSDSVVRDVSEKQPEIRIEQKMHPFTKQIKLDLSKRANDAKSDDEVLIERPVEPSGDMKVSLNGLSDHQPLVSKIKQSRQTSIDGSVNNEMNQSQDLSVDQNQVVQQNTVDKTKSMLKMMNRNDSDYLHFNQPDKGRNKSCRSEPRRRDMSSNNHYSSFRYPTILPNLTIYRHNRTKGVKDSGFGVNLAREYLKSLKVYLTIINLFDSLQK